MVQQTRFHSSRKKTCLYQNIAPACYSCELEHDTKHYSQGCIQKFCQGGGGIFSALSFNLVQTEGKYAVGKKYQKCKGGGENDTRGGECPPPLNTALIAYSNYTLCGFEESYYIIICIGGSWAVHAGLLLVIPQF